MSYYTTNEIKPENAMDTLRSIFPDGEANDMNFVIFSTSGVHGHYGTIEDAEEGKDDEGRASVTFLVIKPRIVQTLWGNCYPETQDDFDFLKKLRATSGKAMAELSSV